MLGYGTASASLYTTRGARKYLTADERGRFIAAAEKCSHPLQRTLCLTLAYSGCRISEALALTASSIIADAGIIAVRSLKKRKDYAVIREIPVPHMLIDTLLTIHQLHSSEPGKRLWSWSRGRAWQLIKEVMRQAGISAGVHATPKGLRHAYGVHAIRSKVPLMLIQRWMGHARLETTGIYLQAVGDEEREIAERMWQ